MSSALSTFKNFQVNSDKLLQPLVVQFAERTAWFCEQVTLSKLQSCVHYISCENQKATLPLMFCAFIFVSIILPQPNSLEILEKSQSWKQTFLKNVVTFNVQNIL